MQAQAPPRSLKALKLFMVVSGVLLLCWLPYITMEVWSSIAQVPEVGHRSSGSPQIRPQRVRVYYHER
jgi:hypothetical protein